MRKLFLLLPALVLSLFANAAVINITPTSPHSSGNNLLAALQGASDGDVIILADGVYNESSNYIVFDKSVEVRAEENAHPTIEVETYIKVDGNKDITIRGIKFDAAKQGPTGTISSEYEHFIRIYSAGTLELDNCEFCNTQANKVIKVEATSHIDYLKINNCYFHDGNNSAIHVYQSNSAHACDKIGITNSTFANYTGFSDGLVEVFTKDGALQPEAADDAEFMMDHCTFYKYIKTSDNTYGFIDVRKSSKTTISNCIFMNPTIPDGSYNAYATYTYGGTISNCIYHGTRGNRLTPSASSDANPLFVDAANGDFTLKMGSPARGAATDASDMGDPRWTEIIPIITDFSSPLVLEAVDATKNSYFSLDANNYLKSANPTPVTTEYGIAEWQIHSNTPACVQVTLNMYSGSLYGHTYKVAIYNSSSEELGEVGECGWSDVTTDIPLTGTIYLPEAGDYTIQLSNICNGSVATIQGITLSYAGGAVQDIPGTLTASDAFFSEKGSRADGMISFSTYEDQWVKWNASTSGSGTQSYAVTLNINNPTAYGHRFTVSFYLNENESPVASLTENAWNETYGEPLAIYLGEAILAGSNAYVVKVTNAENGAQPKIISIGLVATGGAVQEIPGTITLSDAILSTRAFIDGNGLHFADNDHLGHISEEYAKWNIHVAADGIYKFTANCNSSNYSNLTIQVLQGGEEKYTYTPEYSYSGEKTIVSPEWFLEAGNYELKLSNPANNSNGYLVSLIATAEENVFIMDENTTDDGSIAAAAAAGISYKFLLKRSFTAGRYYTICIPVGSWNDELKLAFGADYELWKMSSATQAGDEISLNFEQCNTESFHAGWPYLIKPSIDVENPIFYNKKTIQNSTYNNVQSFAAADFIGSFYKTVIPAGESNLYLQNNDLYYSETNDTPIKGTRAWIQLKQSGSLAPARARIVLLNQVVTNIQLAEPEENKAIKTIENGQLIIIRDGVRYNAMGVVMK